jgi:uncharacterized protein
MRLDRDAAATGPLIRGISGGGFRVDDTIHHGSLQLTPKSARDWPAPAFEALAREHVADLLALDPIPEFLLLGTGPGLRRPPPSFVTALEALGVGVEAMDSRAAARAWGLLRGEGRWIAAAIYALE